MLLFLAEEGHHVIPHLNHFGEVDVLAVELQLQYSLLLLAEEGRHVITHIDRFGEVDSLTV